MVHWPAGADSVEGVYMNNEYLTFSGRYPVGANRSWHSGIHIRSSEIYPMIEGLLAAYRISSKISVPRLQDLTGNEYNNLHDAENELYEENTRRPGKYKLKDEMPEGLEEYRDEQYTNSFFLIRHRVRLPSPSARKYLEFFTLYTNIAPPESRNEEYQTLDEISEERRIPFYEKFLFKVTNESLGEYRYHGTPNGAKIFPGNQCKFVYKDSENFTCTFINSSQSIDLPKDDIEITDMPTYKSNAEEISFYRVEMGQDDAGDEDERKKFQRGTLKREAIFKTSIEFCYAGYVKVKVNADEVISDNPIDDGTQVIVRFSDLENTINGKGKLRRNNSICTSSINGLLVYDGSTVENNIRDIITVGAEFELEEPGEFWETFSGNNRFVALKRGGVTERKRYLYVTRKEALNARIMFDTRFKLNETIIMGGSNRQNSEQYPDFEPLDYQTLLGKPLGRPRGHREYYDLVLLFNDIDFMKSPGEEDNLLGWNKFFRVIDTEPVVSGSIFRRIAQYLQDNRSREADRNGDIIYDGTPDWYLETVNHERVETKRLKRTLVCRHPLEWDRDLYLDGDAIKPAIRKQFGVAGDQEHTTHFINQVTAIDIWSGLKDKRIEGLDLSQNNFWFAHPAYFINHLEQAGLITVPRIRNLLKVQNEVVALPCLVKDTGRGIYGIGNAGDSYCNHAAFITILAVDENCSHFTNRPGAVFPEHYTRGQWIRRENIPAGYQYKKSNYWCDILTEQKEHGLITPLANEDEAKMYADMGYVVIGAWKTSDDNKNGSPHYATVRPGYKNHEDGITLANVGETNGIKRVVQGFGAEKRNDIKWYYNPDQDFRYEVGIVLRYLGFE
jgi:hypothetical protein